MARKFVVTARGVKLDMDALKKSQPNAIPVRNFPKPSPVKAAASTKGVKVVPAKSRQPRVKAQRPVSRKVGQIAPPMDRFVGLGPVPTPIQTQIPSHPPVQEGELNAEKQTKAKAKKAEDSTTNI